MEGGISAASPHRLILLLMEGALVAISIAKLKMSEGEIQERGRAISKAISLIDEGLRASLDLDRGGEIAEHLDALYDYMSRQLFMANLKNSPEMLEEIYRILSDIKGSWEAIDPASKIDSNTAPLTETTPPNV